MSTSDPDGHPSLVIIASLHLRSPAAHLQNLAKTAQAASRDKLDRSTPPLERMKPLASGNCIDFQSV